MKKATNIRQWRLYVSLPISGHSMVEVRDRCLAAVLKYTEKGYQVIHPLDVVRDQSTPYAACIGMCVEALMNCDAAVFLKGWESSRGSRAERAICHIYGIETIDDQKL